MRCKNTKKRHHSYSEIKKLLVIKKNHPNANFKRQRISNISLATHHVH
jgi:transcriptional regulator NrdR family protein